MRSKKEIKKTNKVRERRKELGKSQAWLSEKTNLSRVYISEIENNKRERISLNSAKNIAQALGRFVEELFP